MRITVLTLFPDIYPPFLNSSIIKRANNKGVVEVKIVDIRDFSKDKHRHVDDTPYGGGAGMLLQVEPIVDALRSVKTDKSRVLITSPKAKPFTQKDAIRLSKEEDIVIICGHYEGHDARVEDYVDERFSIGDYILTGGEVASLVLIDAVTRLLKDAISSDSLDEESYDSCFLEYPQYTKPYEFEGKKVPDVLLSGDHKKIAHWRKKMALYETLAYRKDLLKDHQYTDEEIKLLKELQDEINNR